MPIVIDGVLYALALGAAGGVVAWVAGPWFAAPLWTVGAFCLYFFRDPERRPPAGDVAVSPADGKVVAVKPEGAGSVRISVFLNVFDVHVNRSPVAGEITEVRYQPGRFHVASREESSRQNEQNIITIAGDGTTVVLKQIAGLIARRVVCSKRPGDRVALGERVGLIKFGSRADIVFGPEWEIAVRLGQRVKGGSSVIARRVEALAVSAAAHALSGREDVMDGN